MVVELCNTVPFGGDSVSSLCKGEGLASAAGSGDQGSTTKTPLELLADDFTANLPKDAAGTSVEVQTKEQAQQAQKLALELYAQGQALAGARLDRMLASFLRRVQKLDISNGPVIGNQAKAVEGRAQKAEAAAKGGA
jgi:hypothetical protein